MGELISPEAAPQERELLFFLLPRMAGDPFSQDPHAGLPLPGVIPQKVLQSVEVDFYVSVLGIKPAGRFLGAEPFAQGWIDHVLLS
nr:hypothetical protein [Caenispirillum salinarum]